MTPAELEQRIDASVNDAQNDGWTILDGLYFVPRTSTCCALSACVLRELSENASVRLPGRILDVAAVIERELGIDPCQRVSFTVAFDGGAKTYYHSSEFYDLGARMRAKYIEAK